MLGRETLNYNRARVRYASPSSLVCDGTPVCMRSIGNGVSKRVDGTRFNDRLVSDLKKDLDSIFLSWMASLETKMGKEAKL